MLDKVNVIDYNSFSSGQPSTFAPTLPHYKQKKNSSMNRFLLLLYICLGAINAYGQHISHIYNNVTLSEALRQLNEQSEEYTISFLYNE